MPDAAVSRFHESQRDALDQRSSQELAWVRMRPAAFALFPEDINPAPREWAERFFNLQRWTEMPCGGHFAALEEPELLAEDIRAFYRPLRKSQLEPDSEAA